MLDLYTRDTKRGGAWMNSIVSQSRLRGTKPIVVNNLNVPKPAPGMPALLTLDEVTTLFHEFGHALHGLFATVTYPHFAGTNVFRDFVEFPSQVNEMWIYWPEILERLRAPRRHRRAAARRGRRRSCTRPRPSIRASPRASTSRRPGSTRRGTR